MGTHSKHSPYIRVGEFTVESVLPYVVGGETLTALRKARVKKNTPEYIAATEREYEGHMVKMGSQRYQVFALRGVTCVTCGLIGEFFGLEKIRNQDGDRYHFNLYGMRDGKEVMLTKDHVIPKSKGGANTLANYQVMCFDCNIEKADTLI
jgi:hypothetical protein